MYSWKHYSKSIEIYKDEIKNNRPLSNEEEAEAARGIKKGDKKSFKKLVKANLRFVVGVACQYQNQGVPVEDLVSAGNIGLVTAAKKFNPDKNFRFISYAIWWIRQSILVELANQSRITKIPLRSVQYIYKSNKAIKKFEQKHNKIPTIEDISKITGIKKHLIHYTVMSNAVKVSFDATVGDNRDTFHDLYYDENQEETSYIAEQKNLAKKIDEILDEFTPREKNIIQRYYGLNGYAPEIMDGIGEVHDITRERVRQILKKVLNSLRYRFVGIV